MQSVRQPRRLDRYANRLAVADLDRGDLGLAGFRWLLSLVQLLLGELVSVLPWGVAARMLAYFQARQPLNICRQHIGPFRSLVALGHQLAALPALSRFVR